MGGVYTGPVEMHLGWLLTCDRILRASLDLEFLWHVFQCLTQALRGKRASPWPQKKTHRTELGYAISRVRRGQFLSDDRCIVLRWSCLNREIALPLYPRNGNEARRSCVCPTSYRRGHVLLDRASCTACPSQRGRQEWLVFVLLSKLVHVDPS